MLLQRLLPEVGPQSIDALGEGAQRPHAGGGGGGAGAGMDPPSEVVECLDGVEVSGGGVGGELRSELVAGLDLGEGSEELPVDRIAGDVGVAQGHEDAAMAEELHDAQQVHAGGEQLRGERVAEAVGGDFFGDIEVRAGATEQMLETRAPDAVA